MLIQSTGLVLISPVLLVLTCVCVCVFSSMHSSFITCVGVRNYHHSDALCIFFPKYVFSFGCAGSSLLPGGFL